MEITTQYENEIQGNNGKESGQWKRHKSPHWFDSWINVQSLMDLIREEYVSFIGGNNKRASSLISDGRWREAYLSSYINQQISKVPLTHNKSKDYWDCKPHNNCDFSFK